ncbi:MAG: DEAD/DEAH box helicase family protein [Bacteroidales bacterium]|nr:DEAD/DEAH box helicase family protein [Bacteroidales bacterium]
MKNNLKANSYPDDLVYSSDAKHKPLEFYIAAISQAQKIDLKLGYFSSNAIRVLSIGFASFIQRGGKLRIITNHFFTEKDKRLFFDDTEMDKDAEQSISSIIKEGDYESLEKLLVEGEQHFFDCLKYLKNNNLLEIQPVKLKEKGMSHYKQGIFDDGENQVSFSGSCNFTYNGLIENGETLNLDRSWGSDVEQVRITNLQKNINNIFEKKDNQYTYLISNDILELIDEKADSKDMTELLRQEHRILNKALRNYSLSTSAKNALYGLNWKLSRILGEPSFPFEEGPRDYQAKAYENWVKNNRKGIFAMATGTGKTITALNCLLNEFNDTGIYQSLILVPTLELIEQWKNECYNFGFKNVIVVSSKSNWDNELAFINLSNRCIKNDFIIIVTYSSFHRKRFQEYFRKLPNKTILIADEAHNLGSKSILKQLNKVHLIKRIGLSATIKRVYDEHSNKEINGFFNDSHPYTYSLSMRDAIKKKWLTPYKYYPHIVKLTQEEFQKYIDITLQIVKFYNSSSESFINKEIVEMKKLERKRIIHKAQNKLNVFKSILNTELEKRRELRYTLVYVPEGESHDYNDKDFSEETNEEQRLIDNYTRILSSIDPTLMVRQFTSMTKDRKTVIDDFEKGRIHVLSSMKCLDEGVDIPKAKLAIFCSSTGNPRQFIQRRGRILRRFKGKTMAVIHDLVVIPMLDRNEKYFNMERNLVKNELKRVVDFSSLALNKMDTFIRVRRNFFTSF